jgi:hypothetical protein
MTIARAEATRYHLGSRQGESLPVEGTLASPTAKKEANVFDHSMSHQVVDMPAQAFLRAQVAGDAPPQPSQRIARIHIPACGKTKDAQCSHLQGDVFWQKQHQLIGSRLVRDGVRYEHRLRLP